MRPYWIRLLYSFCGIFVVYGFIIFVKYKSFLQAPKHKRRRSFFERQEMLRQSQKHSSESTSFTSRTGTASGELSTYSSSSPVSNYNDNNRNYNAGCGSDTNKTETASKYNSSKYRNIKQNFAFDSDADSTDSEAAKTDFTQSSKATSRFMQFSASRDAHLDSLEASRGHYFAYLTDPESSDHTESSGDELLSADLW